MIRQALDLVETALAQQVPGKAADAFARRLRPLGPSFFQVRRYRRPGGVLTSETHWQAGGVLRRDARPGWVGSTGFHYICLEQNPLLRAVAERRTRYRFSDFAPHSDRHWGSYWEAFQNAAIAEGIGANAYGSDRRVVSVHVGLDQARVDADLGRQLTMASGIVAEHLMELDASFPYPPSSPDLTARERDVMRYVADGKTDWEIGTILSVSESTARFHADNARRKLKATNRAHAVARFIAEDGLA